jgi:Zn-dependent protease
MSRSWKIGRAYGIDIFIHWTFLLLPVWILLTQTGSAALLSLALVTAMFGCVVLHELGHALTARHFGIGTRDITLYPIGGVARLDSVGNKPAEEFWIAVAGPAVNVVIALGLGCAWFVAFLLNPMLAYVNPVGQFVFWLAALNVGMVVFNLLPAFPMDGGRVLRSLLAMGLGQERATRIAVNVATVVAIGLAFAGVMYLHNPWLVVIAALVLMAGFQEMQELEAKRRLQFEHAHPYVTPQAGWWHAAPAWQHEPRRDDPWAEYAVRPQVTVHVWDPVKHVWVKQ